MPKDRDIEIPKIGHDVRRTPVAEPAARARFAIGLDEGDLVGERGSK
jgi:hypothetical protein